LLSAHHQQVISAAHPLPVIFIRTPTNETDLIMLSMVAEAWPSKSVGAKFSDEPLQECHVDPSLSQGQDSVAFELW
jgi:hypothetical protein